MGLKTYLIVRMHRLNNHTVVWVLGIHHVICPFLLVCFVYVCVRETEVHTCLCSKVCGGIGAELLGLEGFLAYFIGTVI